MTSVNHKPMYIWVGTDSGIYTRPFDHEACKALRDLREWHALKFRQARTLELKYIAQEENPKFPFKSKARTQHQDYHRKCAEHMRAIQALNSLFQDGDYEDLTP